MKYFLSAARLLLPLFVGLAGQLRAEGSAPAAVAVPVATSVDALRTQIETYVALPRFSGALWGVKVVSLETGRTLFEHHADRLMSPASNCKLYTSALALDRLGGDYRIVTPIYATAKPDAAGELRGDLIVSGRGDPSWKTRGTKKAFWETFEPFVDVLVKAGVRHVTGDLVADATFFRGLPTGSSWTADDLMDDYGAEISAISLEDNYADLRLTPANTAGRPANLEMLQPMTGLVLDNRTQTGPAGGPGRIFRRRLLGENIVHLFGELPMGGKEQAIDVTVPHPADWFAAALKEALARHGIRVDGRARSVRWPDAPATTATSEKLGEISSPPLRELITALMKPSQNLETDLIFGHLGETLRAADAPPLQTSEDSALALLQAFLRTNQLPADEVRFDEGSGLSRNNLASANSTVALLKFMTTHRAAKDYADSLPIAGVDGTLRRRMKGTPAENNIHAKTGTLRYANSIAGYVTSAAGEQLAFCVMLNRNVPPPGRSAGEEVDEIAVMLAKLAGRSAGIAEPLKRQDAKPQSP